MASQNIPFAFDFLLGGGYNVTGLQYTLVPTLASLRWHMGDVRGPSILRGNWDLTLTAAFTAIPRGPETNYEAYDMGIRRNFVHRNWKIAPYFDGRLGMGRIDAKGPKGARYAQGQDFTFTMMMGRRCAIQLQFAFCHFGRHELHAHIQSLFVRTEVSKFWRQCLRAYVWDRYPARQAEATFRAIT